MRHKKLIRAAALCAALVIFVLCSPHLAAKSAGAIPAHVMNFTLWKQSGVADQVPVSWAAANATFVETRSPAFAAAFHAAGGQFTVAYSDPNYYYEAADYHSPGDFPEDAFGHDAGGSRISRLQGHGVEYYLLPNSTTALKIYSQVTAKAVASGAYDFLFADGVSDSLAESTFRMSSRPVEIASDRDYVAGMKRLLAAAARPVIINGFNNGNPLAIETYATSSNVAGIYGEECFHSNRGPKTEEAWRNDAQSLLYTTAHDRYAFCGGHGNDPDNRAERLYWLASWWLTFDLRHSVAMEEFESPGDVYVFPEIQLVPTGPLQTAGGNIDRLRASSGVYLREFRSCYEAGSSIGPCAAVVNPSAAASAPLPSTSQTYSRSLSLRENNLFDGGRLGFASPPSVLGPGQAVILVH
mgnify:CR=1 FL=1